MTLYPDVQAKARAELDRVFSGQLPSVASKDDTPYLNAIILETLRWHPSIPGGELYSLLSDRARCLL